MRAALPLLALALLVGPGAVFAQSPVTYRVTLDATWSAQTHPDGFPGDPHFSPLVGAVHADGTHLWEARGTASPGMESMAETGATSTLADEADAMVASGDARQRLVGGAINLSPGSTSMDIEVSESHSRVTLVTMIAPSPDWFIGTEGLDLQDASGAWLDEVVVPMYAWDAGTDSGPDYTSSNQDTSPQEPISLINASPFVVGGSMAALGTMTFTRLTPASGEETPEAGQFSVGEQPIRDRLTLTLPASPEASVELFDLRGRRVRSIARGPLAAGTRSIDVSDLAPGMYLARLVAGQTVVTRRVVVAR